MPSDTSDVLSAVPIAGNASTVDASDTINDTTISHLEESSISDIKDEKFNYLQNNFSDLKLEIAKISSLIGSGTKRGKVSEKEHLFQAIHIKDVINYVKNNFNLDLNEKWFKGNISLKILGKFPISLKLQDFPM